LKKILPLVLCIAFFASFGVIKVFADPDTPAIKKTAMPSSYPMPGTYDVDYMDVRVGTSTPGARIWYTLDESDPKTSGTRVYFDPLSAGSIATAARFGRGRQYEKATTIIKAYAEADGMPDSDVATFKYDFVYSIRRGEYRSEILREGTADIPSLIRISDDYRVNCFLIVGSERAVLIDGANETQADNLITLIDQLSGGLPYEMLMTHPDGDHAGSIRTLAANGIEVFVPRNGLSRYPAGVDYNLIDDGDTWNLGNAVITAYDMVGHSTAHMVFLCEKTGDLFSSDALGNTNPWGMNSALLGSFTIEDLNKNFIALRDKLAGRAVRTWKAHDTFPTMLEPFLNNQIAVTKDALIRGEAAVIPNIRSGANGGGPNSPMIGYGNYRTDHDAVAIHASIFANGSRPVRPYQQLVADGFDFGRTPPYNPVSSVNGPEEPHILKAGYTISSVLAAVCILPLCATGLVAYKKKRSKK
jgi:glyoxylase-like metal-dependent hydrolase (beta-lactamase superfamily II)